jgi:hypothetical protein
MRTSLLERLKVEFVNGLKDEENEEYKASIKDIKDILSDKQFYDDLTVSDIKRVWLFSSVPGAYNRDSNDWKFGQDMFELEKGCA